MMYYEKCNNRNNIGSRFEKKEIYRKLDTIRLNYEFLTILDGELN